MVGRSLDMFISKLRKKLELDPNIKIVLYAARDISLKLALKKAFPLQTDVIRIQYGRIRVVSFHEIVVFSFFS
jgi:hypothetical protein